MAESESLENPNAPITGFVKTSQSSLTTTPGDPFCQGSLMHQAHRPQIGRPCSLVILAIQWKG